MPRWSPRCSWCAPKPSDGWPTGWFGEDVLHLAADDPTPLALLTREVWSSFPDHAPCGGEFVDPVPQLTIGHGHPVRELEAAEVSVNRRLPLDQHVDHLELWSGPAVEGRSRSAPWRHVRDYPLG